MATIASGVLKYIGNLGGDETTVLTGIKETNSQTFKKGQLVYLDSNGTIAVTGTAASSATGLNGAVGTDDELRMDGYLGEVGTTGFVTPARKILGIALKDATNTTTANIEIPVQVLRNNDILEGNLVTGIVGDQDPAGMNLVLAATHLGNLVSLLYNTTNNRIYFTVTTTVVAATKTTIFGTVWQIGLGGGRGAIGDTNARVRVLIRSDVLLAGGGQ